MRAKFQSILLPKSTPISACIYYIATDKSPLACCCALSAAINPLKQQKIIPPKYHKQDFFLF
ncbi:MAG: hypothetical protein OFPI_21640 [Osedax symbiont Rs2]|nr:MAG: hypothetical protein OFPI_21640 [Osedax symbiont Rs2]